MAGYAKINYYVEVKLIPTRHIYMTILSPGFVQDLQLKMAGWKGMTITHVKQYEINILKR